MVRLHRSPKGARRAAALLAGATVLGLTGLAAAAVPGAVAGATTTSTSSTTPTLTVPTARHHHYRHGAVPRKTRDVRGVQALQAGTTIHLGPKTLTYGGGTLTPGSGLTGAGVTTGQPKIYLVFMGAKWGTETVNGSGVASFTGDPDGMAPALQAFYSGLGTAGETWSGVMTQYCDGTSVGSATCSFGDAMIPHPVGGVLAGIWYDHSSASSAAETAGLTGSQLAAEAEAAATRFGNSDQASNRTTQYVIVSPKGTNPDGWADPVNGYCAYHDDTHDPSISGAGPVPGPTVAFTNLPYVPDAGASCGSGTVNTPGTLDGATEAASHEYAETLTDQFPESTLPGGWTDSAGAENGDLCAYVAAPAIGPAFNLTLATGTVAVQGTWSNRARNGRGGCSDGESDFAFVPTVTSVSPASGPAGSTVTVNGTDLQSTTSVSFAGTAAGLVGVTPTSVTVTVPSGAADGTVTVTGTLGTAVSPAVFHLAPSIDSFTPGTQARGGTVTITGSGLGTVKKVTIGGKRATMTSETTTQIVVTVPNRAVTGSVVAVSKYGTAVSPTALTVG